MTRDLTPSATLPTLYDNLNSGNGYKVRLLVWQLGMPVHRVEVDSYGGATRTEEFLALNPNGKIPVMRWPDGRTLSESNALLTYLAEGTPLMPADPWQRARVLQWLFWEQYSHEPAVAVARFLVQTGAGERDPETLRDKQEKAVAALALLDRHLAGRTWMVGETCTVADIALYAYSHVADEGGVDPAPLSHLQAWLQRVAARPNHIPLSHDRGWDAPPTAVHAAGVAGAGAPAT